MSNKNYLNPARYVRSKCAIFSLPINARNAIAFQIITVIIYVVLPYTVGGYPPSESYSSVYIEIRLGNLSRRFVLMLTTELFIAIISLCITCFALGYTIGSKSKK